MFAFATMTWTKPTKTKHPTSTSSDNDVTVNIFVQTSVEKNTSWANRLVLRNLRQKGCEKLIATSSWPAFYEVVLRETRNSGSYPANRYANKIPDCFKRDYLANINHLFDHKVWFRNIENCLCASSGYKIHLPKTSHISKINNPVSFFQAPWIKIRSKRTFV